MTRYYSDGHRGDSRGSLDLPFETKFHAEFSEKPNPLIGFVNVFACIHACIVSIMLKCIRTTNFKIAIVFNI